MDEGKTIVNQPEKLMEMFGQHFVALNLCVTILGSRENESDIQYPIIPGFLMCVEGVVFFVTAGHVLNQIKQSSATKETRIDSAKLVDVWGAGAISDYPIPFRYEPSRGRCPSLPAPVRDRLR